MLCPSFETLAMYAQGELLEREREALVRHLAEPCAACRERLEWYTQALEALKNPLDDGPDALVEQVCKLYQESIYVVPNQLELTFAVLAFDSLTVGERAGARVIASAPMGGRRLLFHADLPGLEIGAKEHMTTASRCGCDIDIAIRRASDCGHIVQGQILFPSADAAQAYPLRLDLYKGGQWVQAATTNRLGGFVFNDLIEGDYNLQIKSSRWIVVINLPIVLATQTSL
ncbi:MAG: hypothetical protein AB1489_04760 [Acidobacteriota bacterium]